MIYFSKFLLPVLKFVFPLHYSTYYVPEGIIIGEKKNKNSGPAFQPKVKNKCMSKSYKTKITSKEVAQLDSSRLQNIFHERDCLIQHRINTRMFKSLNHHLTNPKGVYM